MLKLLEESPFLLIKEHAQAVIDCISCLTDFLEQSQAGQWHDAQATSDRLEMYENLADERKSGLRLHLHKDLYMPVERGTLLHLVSAQDNMASRAQDITGLVLGRRMSAPKALQDPLRRLLAKAIEACRAVDLAVQEWADFMDHSRTVGHNALIDRLDDLHRFEDESDALQTIANQGLFAIEKDIMPIDAIFLYQLIRQMAALADDAETTGNRLLPLLSLVTKDS